MTWAFMTDPITGNVGLYDEPTTSGAFNNPNSARNAPLNNPNGNLQYIYWHILLDNMAVFSDTTVPISHAAVAAGGTGTGGINASVGFDYSGPIVDWTLTTHNLGYEPISYVALGNNLITPGYIVQIATTGDGGARYATIWSDTVNTYLREYVSRGGATLPAINLSYRVLVIKRQPAAEGNVPPRLVDFNPTTGLTKMGDGRWRSDERYLQVVPGGSPFQLALAATMDANNGAPRFVRPDGTTFNPIPNTLKTGYSTSRFGPVYGPSLDYQGSFTGSPTVILVQAP